MDNCVSCEPLPLAAAGGVALHATADIPYWQPVWDARGGPREGAAFGGASVEVVPKLSTAAADAFSAVQRALPHCCDPNCAWVADDVVVAIKPIRAGEMLTVDHATVAPEEDGAKDAVSFPFDCSCGAVECRETVTADDWSAPAWQRRYAGRMRSAVSVKVQRWWSARFPAAIPATYDSTLVRRHGIAAHWRADLGRYIVNNRPIKAGEDVLVLYTRHTRPTIAQAREMGENRCLQIAADAYQASLSVEDLCNLLSHACDPTCRVVIEYETVPLHPGGRTELPVTLCFAELSDEAVAALPEHECGALRGAVAATDTDAGATSSHEVEVLLDAAASVASSHAGSASSPEDPEARDDGAVRLEVIRMVARRDLPVGSVLSFDYRVTDAEIGEAESFDCVCGAPTCAGSVRGFSSLPRALMQQLVREHGPAWHAAMLDDGDAREAGSR